MAEELTEEQVATKPVIGKINFISEEGWFFIISKEIPFERIFGHWTALRGDTLNFKELEEGMNVEFIPIKIPEKGYRAIKIKVINE
jgi:cold shock CspA family protein